MKIGIVHTVGSPCQCAESVSLGLQELGHEILTTDSNAIELQASLLAHECDFIIDHTDTYLGRGLYRPFVRLLLESCMARIVGSSAKSCLIADNKAASKRVLSQAGIPTPPGIVIQSKEWQIPEWLRPPLIIKPAFEHMSRGVRLIHSVPEAYAEVARQFELLKQPILVESFIPGRELAISLVGNSSHLEVFPILEWQVGTEILSEDFKLMEATHEAHKCAPADLGGKLDAQLKDFAKKAFFALGLQDYARFDLRLSTEGCPFFLEANTTPSLEPMEALATSAQWAGVSYPGLVEQMLTAAQRRYCGLQVPKKSIVEVAIPAGSIELVIPQGVHPPPESTIELARILDVHPGDEVLDLGCGSGLLAIAAAKMGARRVVATDLDSEALESAMDNAHRNGVADRIEFCAGSWFDALSASASSGNATLFDVILATPPQTPGFRPFGPKYGGTDGTNHLSSIIEQAPRFLKAESGRLWLLAISLANPHQIRERLGNAFKQVSLVLRTERPFTKAEYDALDDGLYAYLQALRLSGISEFVEMKSEQGCFYNHFFRAAGLAGI